MRLFSNGKLQEVVQGLDNQSQLFDIKFEKLIEGVQDQSQLLSIKLEKLIDGIKNQSELFNNKLEELIQGLDASRLGDKQQEVVQGLDNQSRLLDVKLEKLIDGIKNQSELFNNKLGEIIQGLGASRLGDKQQEVVQGLDNQSQLLDTKLERLIEGIKNQSGLLDTKLENLNVTLHSQLSGGIAQLQTVHLLKEIRDGIAGNAPLQYGLGGAPPQVSVPARPALGPVLGLRMNDLRSYADVFANIKPWSGEVPRGYLVDFLGTLTTAEFRTMFGVDPRLVGGGHKTTLRPTIADGEGWFEAVNWVVAAQEARGHYVMVTLGACYGAQAVGSYRALQLLNPMPFKLVAVEADPENCSWIVRHFRDNGIDPDLQWLVQAAVSDTNAPVFFPVGSPGTGAQNCFATNERSAREVYVDEFIASGRVEEALRNLLLHNTTGLTKSLVPGHDFLAEIKLLSAVTLSDILGPFDVVDYLEADIQQSEIIVFPPSMALLKRKVRLIHIGTHGRDVHQALHGLFEKDGWEIVFSYEPDSEHNSALGSFKTCDGVLTVKNRTLPMGSPQNISGTGIARSSERVAKVAGPRPPKQKPKVRPKTKKRSK